MSETTPFVDESPDIPTVNDRFTGRCYGSSNVGECVSMGLEFHSVEEWQQHRKEYHPTSCGKYHCYNISSYKRMNSPSSYCIEHVPDDIGVFYAWKRVNQEAKCHVPRLDPDHPLEAALRGLEE